MRLFSDSKIYVFCPSNYRTGGPEALHQLCSQLIQFGANAYMLYFSNNPKFNPNDPVENSYKKYHLPYTFNFDDSERNIVVIPETCGKYLYSTKKAQRVFWWLSVDHYIDDISISINALKFNTLSAPMPKIFYFGKGDDDVIHFAQSEYARQFLKLNGVPDHKIYMLEECINPTYFSHAAHIDLSRKENIVVYNRQKGFEVTQQLMRFAPDIDWRPIEKPELMTPEQVQELLERAKVYIDFGYFPESCSLPLLRK